MLHKSTKLVEKWSNVEGKLSIKDIEDTYIRDNMAKLLENQENLDEAALNEATTFSTTSPSSEDSGQFKPISLALVRRTFPELFANKVIPVQAMNMPVGLAFALRLVYKNNLNLVEAGFDNVDDFSGFTGSASGVSGTADAGTGVATSVGEAFQLDPGTGNMPQLVLKLERTAIEAKTRKLAASFSLEAAQDIKATHDIDIEREMVNILQYEVLAELERELVGRLKTIAVDTSSGGEAAKTVNVTATDGRWQQEKFAAVTNTIVATANKIAISTRRGAGNFVIVSPQVATALQATGAAFTPHTHNVNPTNIMAMVGTINGTITVYRDSYATSDFALVGFKGPGISDGGLIFSPYVTGLISKTIADADFSPRIGVMSRYALTETLLGAGRYYRLINYTNLATTIGLA